MIGYRSAASKTAMSKPLFEPLSDEHARPDAWSGPLGFVIGGFARSDLRAERDGNLACQYFVAAETIVDSILDGKVADYEVANAALFLYRHSFELLLKAGLPAEVRAKKDIHHLGKLVKSYAHHMKQAGKTVPSWVINRCEELASIDPGSVAFRYGDYGTPIDGKGAPIHDEIHVDLLHLKDSMAALNAALVKENWLIRLARGERP